MGGGRGGAKGPMSCEFMPCGWPGPPWKSCPGTPPYPPPPPPPPPRFGGVRRERGRFSPPFPIQHAARFGGPLSPKPQTLNPKKLQTVLDLQEAPAEGAEAEQARGVCDVLGFGVSGFGFRV